VLGGGDTFPLYLSEYRRTEALLREGTYTESTGRALLSILAEQAQQAGWAAFDAGDHDQAVKLYEASRHAAMQAGNAPLAGNALAFLAYQQLGADRSAALRTAVESCCAAGTDAPGGVRALLYERLAWAYALSGNAPETERALETARAGLADAAVEPQPDWTTWVDHNELQIMTGRCWAELRRPLRAAPVLENVLAAFDDTHARDKALYMSWLADAYLAAREIEQAVATIGRALELSAGVASVRPRQRLSPAVEQLRAHSDLPAVRDVLEFADSSS